MCGMRRATFVTLLLLMLAVPRPAHAWGFVAHKFIMSKAIELLPPQLKPFFEANRNELVVRAVDPDTWRTAGFIEEPPHHFIDIDNYGKYPFTEIPHDYDAAVLKFGIDRLNQNGTLPWRAEEEFGNLRRAFEMYKRFTPVVEGGTDLRAAAGGLFAANDVILFSGVAAHYIMDAHVPLHGVANYDGQFTQQRGVHSRWEDQLFTRYQNEFKIAPQAIAPITNAREFVFDRVLEDSQLVPALLKADLDAIGDRDVYDDAYYAAFFKAQRATMEDRLNKSIAAVAALITGAWEAAGKPTVPVTAAPPLERRRRQ